MATETAQHNDPAYEQRVAQLVLWHRLAFESAPIGQAVVGLDGTWLAVNPALCELLGGVAADFEGRAFKDFTHPDDVDTDLGLMSDILEGRIPSVSIEKRYIRLDGTIVPVKLQIAAARDGSDKPLYFVSQVSDLSETKAREQALERAHSRLASANTRFAALLENSADLITITNPSGMILYASPASVSVLGLTPEEVVGLPISSIIHRDDGKYVWPKIHELMASEGTVIRFSCRLRHAQLGWRHAEITSTNRMADPDVQGVVSNVRDITERVLATEQLQHQAMHDPLTGLMNRKVFLDQLAEAIVTGERERSACGVFFIDLDRFKGINDNLGHAIGDRVLASIAKRLLRSLRPGDRAARLGGDEFVVLAEGLEGSDEATLVAEHLRHAVTEPILVAGQSVTVGCSVGIALQRTGHTPEALVQEADIAMYRAKERGRNRSEIYNQAMRVVARQRLEAEQTIRWALDHNRLEVLHQPVVDLRTGQLSGTEALARIHGPDGELIGADSFIPVAEDTGLILPLGELVLLAACGQYADWRGDESAPSRLSVNISAAQLLSSEFAPRLEEILEEYEMAPEQLCLEITESTLIEGGAVVQRHVEALKEIGVLLSLDDFGTGWSSLAYLRRFPVDSVKIDRSFVSGLGVDNSDTEVVKAVIHLGHSLGLSIVAEGVETADQEQLLVAAGCEYAQGFRYSRPIPADQIQYAPEAFRISRLV